MTTLKIARMSIQNFCAVKSLEIAPNGSNLSVFGDNATGKTTIANAFAWLFTGKNAAGTAEFDPAPLDGDNAKIHNIETEVSVEFTDGTDYRRVFCEVWTKKRGELTAQLTGTKTTYFKDGVPMKEKEFTAETDRLFGGSERFRILTAVGYFPAVMDWKSRRKMLIEICGDVSDSDVISAAEELSYLPEILGNHSVDDYLKIVKSRKTALKKEIDTIPARISENKNAAEGAPTAEDIADIETRINSLETEEKALSAKVESYSKSTAADARRNEIRQELERRRTEYLSDYNKEISQYNVKVLELATRRDEIFAERSPLLVKKTELPRRISEMKSQREKLRIACEEIKARVYEGGDICPCCGQALPPEQVEKAISEFNKKKSEELAEISEKARTTCHKDLIAKAEEELSRAASRADELTEQYNAVLAELEEQRGNKPVNEFEKTEEYADFIAKIAAVKDNESVKVPDELVEKYSEITAKIAEEKEKLYKVQAVRNICGRIAELEEQQKSLAAEYAQCEKGEFLCEVFIRTKIALLDERINSRFKTLKFKLFHEQQNGGLQEICKVLIPCESGLVEYEKANNAAQINAGIEIINVISEHFGVELPVFCDNAESVTALSEYGGQMIRLVVSENDKKLRFE